MNGKENYGIHTRNKSSIVNIFVIFQELYRTIDAFFFGKKDQNIEIQNDQIFDVFDNPLGCPLCGC